MQPLANVFASRKIPLFLAILLAACAVIVFKSRASRDSVQWTFESKPGPWGKLECVHIAVEMPETFVSLAEIKNIHSHWYFKNFSRDQLTAFFKSAELTEAQLNSLLNESTWENAQEGLWISPKDELVLEMGKPARQKIYSVLSKFPENSAQRSPFIYRPQLVAEILKGSGLHETTVKTFHDLLYSHGSALLFADLDILVNHLTDEQEKVRLIKTVSRVSTLLVKLKMDPTANIDQLVEYWSYGGRKKDVRALLESMASVPEGCKIDVGHLMPAFVRQRIYTYPDPSDLSLTNHHCHWTSMNFLNEPPDDRMSQESYVRERIQSEFIPVTNAPRLGDIIFFMDAEGMVIHSATFIADNIVFTKNGGAHNRPWIYMEMEDLLSCYAKPDEPVRTIIYRRKEL